MTTSLRKPESAPSKQNPLFHLVAKAEEHGWSEKKALQEALRTKFLSTVKKKHYEEVLKYLSNLSSSSTDTYPRLLVRVTLQCARRQKIDRGLWFQLNFVVGGILMGASEWSAAADHFVEARKHRPPHLPLHLRQYCDLTLMIAYFVTGNVTAMERLFWSDTKGLQPFEKGRYVGLEAVKAALMLSAQGDFKNAIEALESAKGSCWLSSQNSFLFGWVACLVYSRAGKIEKSIEYLKIPKEFQEPELRTKMRDMYGTALQGELIALGEFDLAFQLADVLHELLESEGEVYGALRWNKNKAEILHYLNRDDEALDIYERTLEVFQGNRQDSDAADCMLKIACILREHGDYERAREMVNRATQIYQRKELSEQLARCEWETGELLLNQGKYEEAYSIFSRSSQSIWGGKFDFVANHSIGEALKGMGRLQEAREAYVTVTESLENFIEGLTRARHRHLYGHLLYGTFLQLIDICLSESDFMGALEYVERSKNRGLTEILRSIAHLPDAFTEKDRREFKNALVGLRAHGSGFIEENDFDALQAIATDSREARLEYQDVSDRFRQRDPTFLSNQDPEVSYEDIRVLADTRTALIELFPMEDKTVIFVVRHDADLREGTIIVENYGISELSSDSEALRTSGSVNEVKEVLDSILKRLYEKIFSRIQPLVAKTERLIFIPSSEFHLVPWHALYSEENGRKRYVLDDRLVSYAPSAQILRLCLSRNPPGMKRAFVGHANPDKRRRLRYSGVEANAIARLHGVEPVLKSTKRDVIEHGGPCDILHYTGHANSESLELHAEQNIEEKELLHLSEIVERLHLPNTDLVVLSACETGKVRAGLVEDYIGVTSGFLMAGAATVVSSLWRVSDLSTCLLMGKMYALLSKGVGKAQALKDAQLWLRDSSREDRLNFLNELGIGSASSPETASSDPMRFTRKHRGSGNPVGDDLSHPYYWAGFICTGAP